MKRCILIINAITIVVATTVQYCNRRNGQALLGPFGKDGIGSGTEWPRLFREGYFWE